MHRSAVWAIPSNDVVRRIKKIEPHITIVGSILLSHQRAGEGFTEACESFQQHSFKVGHVARKFFYQCVSLFIHPVTNLTEEERIRAQEKVIILDESSASLSLPINIFELYKTNNEYRDQQSWEKVIEYRVTVFRLRGRATLRLGWARLPVQFKC
ncbi:RNA ligase/cyclic nucleotide phosphodiesterase family protein [Prunus dulcis]|uniref:RNA ligase/cyclic nucleotide phosphodiesterase family protein n=1 Tax=Prunus dulcis TaxID=3755 RepID=A0A4Y1RQH0_PRUDU|nr:RNA ligase/cyclic nucleotide phosphodiesterase family protein [Prunus dulcis]